MAAIKIVMTPDGEAPLAIRQAWIGCVLPLPNNSYGQRRRWRTEGVLSGMKRSWLARLLFPAAPKAGYPVRVLDALQVLETRAPHAAQWWRENTPHMLTPNHLFIFDPTACEEVPLG